MRDTYPPRDQSYTYHVQFVTLSLSRTHGSGEQRRCAAREASGCSARELRRAPHEARPQGADSGGALVCPREGGLSRVSLRFPP